MPKYSIVFVLLICGLSSFCFFIDLPDCTAALLFLSLCFFCV